MNIKIKLASMVAVVLGMSQVQAADYSVGVVGPVGFGSGLNLYKITENGVKLVEGSPYIRKKKDISGHWASVLLVSMNPAHDFVYVVYTGPNQPIIVGFQVTPKGLVEHWEHQIQTGDAGLQYSTVTALDNFAIEDTHPGSFTHWISVLTQSGQTIVFDQGGAAESYLVSGHIDDRGKFYYSCRSSDNDLLGGVPPADKVAVYDLRESLVSSNTVPIVTSADPTFVASICN